GGRPTRLHRMAPYRASRRRLVAMNVLVVSGILALMAIAIYGWELHASDDQVNGQLTTWASRESLRDLPVGANGQLQPEAGDGQDLAERYEPSSPNVFSLAVNAQGKVVFDPGNLTNLGLPDMAAAQNVLAGGQRGTLVTVTIRAHDYRLYTVPIAHNGHIAGALQVGISLAARERQLHDLLFILAGVGAGVLLLTALASLYLADRALVPMRLAFDRQRQFAAAASHELRTPLAIMRSQAELVERTLKRYSGAGQGDAQAQDDLREIVAEVDYMSRLVRDLLLLARDESDLRGLAWETVDVRALVREATTKVRAQADARALTLAVEAGTDGDEPAPVRGDADRLRQLLLILVENAIQYTEAGGTITVVVHPAQERRLLIARADVVRIIVTDTGQGIRAEDSERIFEPFYHAPTHATGAASVSGAGLGLALARWIATAHGGEITVRSAPGAGSSFTVALPAAKRSPES
ncbi:MAG: sensor histidine kinase, partial [Ktedonobacterales bacterium]